MIETRLNVATGEITIIDDRTPEQVAADELAAAQEGAVLSRAEFCTACYVGGILTKQESVDAAKGEMPAVFVAALEAAVASGDMTQADADAAEILWAGLTQVERNHPLIPVAQRAFGLTDAQVDELFRIAL